MFSLLVENKGVLRDAMDISFVFFMDPLDKVSIVKKYGNTNETLLRN
jgi:hypothetical protein